MSTLPPTWDQETDVIVIGYGFAGATAAITAHDAGSEVLLLEKAPDQHKGGNSRVSANLVFWPDDVDKAKLHFEALAGPYVATLMKKMGVAAIYRRPNTSKPEPGHKIYPYLLRKLAVTRPNQVWATDITYVPMARGFVYLVAIVDWFSRRVLAWRLSITLTTDFCIEALEEALARFGKPDIFNTDQGSQFTSIGFTSVLQREKIAISMDGRGAWRDNVFVERLWRSVKYEEVYTA